MAEGYELPGPVVPQLRRLWRKIIREGRGVELRPAPAPAGLEAFRPMSEWDERDETVLLLVDYREDGEHPLDDANFAITIGHNNDHNVGDDEGEGWQFAGWCWCQDFYTEGKGKPVGWMPIPHHLARAAEKAQEDGR